MRIEQRPTQGQVREFWEWHGFRQIRVPDALNYGPDYDKWEYPKLGGWHYDLPAVSLSSLFKWAIPRLLEIKNIWDDGSDGCWFSLEMIDAEMEYCVTVSTWNSYKLYETPSEELQSNPALALFWALWAVKGLQMERV